MADGDVVVLVESKALSIFDRKSLPSRRELAGDIAKHIGKAVKQLRGAVRTLRRGANITTPAGIPVEVDRSQQPHAIVLIPDLSLLSDATEFGGAFVRDASTRIGGHFQILDPVELLRCVQAAEMHSARTLTITPMMTFDYHLLQRMLHAVDSVTPDFGILVRRVTQV